MRCIKCGTDNSMQRILCVKCGNRLRAGALLITKAAESANPGAFGPRIHRLLSDVRPLAVVTLAVIGGLVLLGLLFSR